MDHVLSSYALDGYVHQHTLNYDEPAHWKIILEAALDNYHLRFLHPKTVGKYFHTNIHTFDQMGRHGRFVTARKAIGRLWDMPDDTPIDPYVIVGIYLWPNCLLVGQPDHFELWSFFPDPARPGQSRTEIKFLLPGHVTSDEDREFLMRNVAILTQALDDEDMPMSREIQNNLDRSGTTTDTIAMAAEIAANAQPGVLESKRLIRESVSKGFWQAFSDENAVCTGALRPGGAENEHIVWWTERAAKKSGRS